MSIEEPQVADQVRDHLASLGVPAEAVLIEVSTRRAHRASVGAVGIDRAIDANVNSGDSGSAVFCITRTPARHDVSLYGILWGGGRIQGYATVFVFSSLGGKNLQRSTELGGLTTCASGFHC